MAISQHEIPLFEFDDSTEAVVEPLHEAAYRELRLPEKCVFAFLGEYIDTYAKEHGASVVAHFISITKRYPIYILHLPNEEFALVQAPVGAAPAAQILDWLIAHGVRTVVSAGSCGALEAMEEGAFLVPFKALRDEGTSYHYAPPSRYIGISERARTAICASLSEHGLPHREIVTWSTDGFYRETPEKVAYRRAEGCSAVEMECAALAAVAAFRGATWGMLLYTADSLADVEKYDERNWGGDAYEYALRLCIDALRRL